MPKPKVHAHCYGAGKGPAKEAKTCCGVGADFRRDIWCAITGRRMFPVNLVLVPTCGNCLRTFEYRRYKEYLSALKGVQYVEDLDDEDDEDDEEVDYHAADMAYDAAREKSFSVRGRD